MTQSSRYLFKRAPRLPAIAVLAAAWLIGTAFMPTTPPAEAAPAVDADEESLEERERISAALVEVSTLANAPDLVSPWQRVGTERYTGSGVIIEGRRILTAAHVVSDQVVVTVKRRGAARSVDASVKFAGNECDLAILEVEDETFFDGVEPVALGELPRLGDRVHAYGFPLGGDSISVTAGIVSRIEIGTYTHSGERLLQAQVDAALNQGNSGGPLVAGGRLVGIASEVLMSAENVGYVVPAPVIRHFLADIDDGRVDGFPSLGIDAQTTENKALRASLGLAPGENGALIARLDAGSSVDGVLEPGDVLLEIDGLPVDQDMTIDFPDVGRVAASYAVRRRQVGETVSLEFSRGGERLEKKITLRSVPPLVPDTSYGPPSYLVFGGLVFQPLTRAYIELFEEVSSDMANLYLYQNVRTARRSRYIVLTHVLSAAINRGYDDFEDELIDTVDGVVPRDMLHLASLLDDAKGPYLEIFTLEGRRIVLDLERARGANRAILKRYDIGAARSKDLAHP